MSSHRNGMRDSIRPSYKVRCRTYHAAYGPIASAVIYTDGGGPSHLDVRKYPYRKIARPLWPHDPLPPGRLVV